MVKKAYFFIGLPGAGKSTFTELFNLNDGAIRVSSDDYIEQIAKASGVTYSEAWSPAAAKHAETFMKDQLRLAIHNSLDIVWDQTNLTVKGRKKKLDSIPKDYQKIALVLKVIDHKEHSERLANRPGKVIPSGVFYNMVKSFEFPTMDEGFDYIYQITS